MSQHRDPLLSQDTVNHGEFKFAETNNKTYHQTALPQDTVPRA